MYSIGKVKILKTFSFQIVLMFSRAGLGSLGTRLASGWGCVLWSQERIGGHSAFHWDPHALSGPPLGEQGQGQGLPLGLGGSGSGQAHRTGRATRPERVWESRRRPWGDKERGRGRVTHAFQHTKLCPASGPPQRLCCWLLLPSEADPHVYVTDSVGHTRNTNGEQRGFPVCGFPTPRRPVFLGRRRFKMAVNSGTYLRSLVSKGSGDREETLVQGPRARPSFSLKHEQFSSLNLNQNQMCSLFGDYKKKKDQCISLRKLEQKVKQAQNSGYPGGK